MNDKAPDKLEVKMKETKKGSPDGVRVSTYEKGKTYTLPISLARVFVKELKIAEVAKPKTKVAEATKPKSPKSKDVGRVETEAPKQKTQ